MRISAIEPIPLQRRLKERGDRLIPQANPKTPPEMIMIKLFTPILVAATVVALSSAAQAKAYTCWNPAICKAVCGKPTCGEAFASTAQSQDRAAKPMLSTKAPR
jgi:hypothetical protein